MGSTHFKADGIRALLSKNLRALLREAQLSENALAHKSGVSQRMINGVTRGLSGCGVDVVAGMADSLGMPAWQLILPGMSDAYEDGRRLETIVQTFVTADASHRAALYDCAKKVNR